jgi:hypothetical protein
MKVQLGVLPDLPSGLLAGGAGIEDQCGGWPVLGEQCLDDFSFMYDPSADWNFDMSDDAAMMSYLPYLDWHQHAAAMSTAFDENGLGWYTNFDYGQADDAQWMAAFAQSFQGTKAKTAKGVGQKSQKISSRVREPVRVPVPGASGK